MAVDFPVELFALAALLDIVAYVGNAPAGEVRFGLFTGRAPGGIKKDQRFLAPPRPAVAVPVVVVRGVVGSVVNLFIPPFRRHTTLQGDTAPLALVGLVVLQDTIFQARLFVDRFDLRVENGEKTGMVGSADRLHEFALYVADDGVVRLLQVAESLEIGLLLCVAFEALGEPFGRFDFIAVSGDALCQLRNAAKP